MSSSNLYTAQFEAEHDFPPFADEPRTYVIASTPRSGSHMLGHLLQATGRFGFPLEYLNPRDFVNWRERFGTRGLDPTLAAIRRARTSPNGVFGIKLHYAHVVTLGGAGRLNELLPNARYILLRRVDVLAQAVSYAKAQQTDSWISGMPKSNSADYDYAHIERCLRKLVLDTASWHHLLAVEGLPFLDLTFERVASDPAGAVREVAAFLGEDLDPATIPSESRTQRQSDPTNQAWLDRFRREYDRKPLLHNFVHVERRAWPIRAYHRLRRITRLRAQPEAPPDPYA